ncbi:MAG: SDR family NAD(P)-dependent oxidoreductase [Paracoccaceae bacterium]
MSFSISGKTAIVTGAANGIGLAIARHFAAQGANVMLADMDETRLTEEIEQLGGDEDGNVRCFAGDLRKKLTQANLLSATIDAFDRVDILVNASRQVLKTDPLNLEDDSLKCLLEQNLTTGYRLSQTIAKKMISQAKKSKTNDGPAGTIINISSIASQRIHPDLLAYSVSIAALNQLTRTLAVALAPHHIRVNSVAFGSMMSASLRTALADQDGARDEIIARTPLARIAGPSEIVETVQYLASGASGFLTGQIITADGGRTLVDAVETAAH